VTGKPLPHNHMNTTTSAALGIAFLVLGFAATFLMYYLWGFPFDKATKTSAAPKSLMRLHRVIGYLYGATYVVMMSQMVPRMWQYQVELPARTVAHLILGVLIGIVLFIKIAIMRFFRHLEEWMPALGTTMFVCTVLLMALSLPTALREQAASGEAFAQENRDRVAKLLSGAHLPSGAPLSELSTVAALRDGRSVLTDKCVRCHDLRTVLQKTRTPDEWYGTVKRMAEKPAIFAPISLREQFRVTAYLIAITPEIQKSNSDLRKQGETSSQSGEAISPINAKAVFEQTCAQCHAVAEVEKSPPRSPEEVEKLLARMQSNGMHASKSDLSLISFYLRNTYVKPR